MKILVTGGAGFVGSTLVPMLLAKKHQVMVVDNLMFGIGPLIPLFQNKGFSFVKGDVRDYRVLRDCCKDKDIIIHLAAIVGYPACRRDPILAETTNVIGSKNLIKALGTGQRVLFASTGSNYGAMEKGVNVCVETVKLNPQSVYGKTKARAEDILMNRGNCTSFRFAAAFGLSPRLRLDLLINDFVYQALKQHYLVVFESNFMRTFIHVKDMGRSFVFAIENSRQTNNQVYNLGSEKMNYSKRQICDMLSKLTDVYIHYADVGKDEDMRNYVVSYRKIEKAGFTTTISMEDGMKELIRCLAFVEAGTHFSNV